MKKINYQQVFYKFLVENGLLFEFLELISTNKLNTLEKCIGRNNPKNLIRNAYIYSVGKRSQWETHWDSHWRLYHNKWLKLLIKLNTKKSKKNEKRN